ncbi:hypothetical protein BW13_05090 [Bifidobacterium sp. UTCIF-37]|uniref:alginate lyase family protein n=1 Tax=unclassified Bifidobacterium TaxID=2608897 RepID=UPI00112AEE3F|nr:MULTISPECIES: alginate lyase family protein [unclassified Bifidobacterium]TPF86477.1 hypothetical protein BW13_05090 [Bifidobacterium sp. UTCIF-37]TPF89427.1 hypothetical protein BW11_05100 [Bifidobacterium sp. UTCIF-38]
MTGHADDYPTRERTVERIVRIRTAEGDYIALASDGGLTLGTADEAERFALYASRYPQYLRSGGMSGGTTDIVFDGAQDVTYALRSLTNGCYLTIQNYADTVDADGRPTYYRRRGLTYVVTATAPEAFWNERFTLTDQPDGSTLIASHCDDLRDEPNCSAFPMRVTLSGAYIDYGNVAVQRLFVEDAGEVDSAEFAADSAGDVPDSIPQVFVHPGVNLSAAQLTAMRNHVRAHENPWVADYRRLTDTVPNDMSNERYVPTFREGVGRGNPEGSGHIGDWEMSCAAAYFNALRWVVTGEDKYAAKTVEIIDGWSKTLRVIDGRDRILGASLATIKLINAAEIVRYFDGGYTGFDDEAFARFRTMLHNVIYPVVRDGGAPMNANGNWDVTPMTTLLAIGVATDDRRIFARGVEMYSSRYCNGSIENYLTDWGQSVETARDQAHGQLGIGAMGDTCAIAEHQGVDLWGLKDNRLAKAYEWCACYNLFHGEGELVVTPLSGIFGYFDDISYWDHMEEQGVYRGQLRPIYETALAHYRHVPGVDMTWTERAARAMRPEGLVHFDNLNFSTLTTYDGPAEETTEPLIRLRTMLEPWYQHSWSAIRAAGDVPSNALIDGVLPEGYTTETTPSYFAVQSDGTLAVTAMRRDAALLRLVARDDGTYSLVDTSDGRVLTVGGALSDGGCELRMASQPDAGANVDCFSLRNWGIGRMYLVHDGRLVETVTDGGTPTLRLGVRPEGRNTDTRPANWLLFTYDDADDGAAGSTAA